MLPANSPVQLSQGLLYLPVLHESRRRLQRPSRKVQDHFSMPRRPALLPQHVPQTRTTLL